ncbi:asparaginase [Mesorhizobium sp. M2D.F.Ca.ET.185.01.1.1]|uniref:asparaginase n=1 Tax=unclassified Mesorhizobium TaxID=325217 RepID=UPI000FCCD0AE|nr:MULTISPECIES: asparaginase [unclassified Mesorhizobium]TGP76286.1 asparaginase [bacterium M00.F.Ca.ET.227.01.1.1]TGP92340.1 asparaginase [bacterium M00.F.Ca.ET.222.01.1.1]TGP96894.1 asparaginase [bacterium M00.F.Ca.ET.221.01.1.1]TGU06644.1 asparaginase [bacterium M00.F.Ca.ET.163.01.1.1]TGU27727.1 asparaginase [bacterium M00.F.Ca.ET.156.01.1.1]TGU50106.1 asparaginase [bacterium M00.F.Ca.ET.146.01.1.1]TGV68065.1 asparaginase [Mesorhizobium sp. M2D.F.Ca.ET.160.01.1.1]TGV79465.1 asparaginase
MANPVLVEVTRGSVVESTHRGAVSVFDADGKAVWEIGDTDRPVFPRSAVKAIQALPLVESGAADAYGFGDRELALACASHSGEPAHVELARAMLAKAGLDKTALECGAHWPNHEATIALARAGEVPSALHNNCSGKHAGFLCTCVHSGIAHQGYVKEGHAQQEMVRDAMQSVTGAAHNTDNSAIDGCSIPTYAVPLKGLAQGFARMATGRGFSPERAKAAKRLLSACMAEPFLVAGTGKADVALMQAAPGRIFVKTGAEGVYCAALPELGLGIALKCDDGAARGAEVMIAAVLAKLLRSDEVVATRLTELAHPAVESRIGAKVGLLRPTPALN